MSESNQIESVVSVPVPEGHGGHSQPSVIDVNGPLVVLTWITFGLLAAILYKVAWKPILNVLDQREQSVRKAMDDAAVARKELTEVEVRSRELLALAEKQREELLTAARAAAIKLAETLEVQARQEIGTMMDEAHREIAAATGKARATLRAEVANLAIDLAGKVILENMDSARNRILVDKLMKEI